jgi:hypothetical protein
MTAMVVRIASGVFIAALLSAPAAATDHPLKALKLSVARRRAGGRVVWSATTPPLPSPAEPPTTVGGTFVLMTQFLGYRFESGSAPLPAGDWQSNGAGTRYQFVNKEAPGGPSKVSFVSIKQRPLDGAPKLKVIAKDTMVDDVGGPFFAALIIGNDTYCSLCTKPHGGSNLGRNTWTFYHCDAPADCVFPTTTTTTTTTLPASLPRDSEPIVLSGATLPTLSGTDPNEVFVFRFDATAGWQQIPHQVDERRMTPENGTPESCPVGCELQYVFSGTEGNGLDDDDEVVFMGADVGERASGSRPPGVSGSGYEVAVTRPEGGPAGYAYVFASSTLSKDFGPPLVSYTRTPIDPSTPLRPGRLADDLLQSPHPERDHHRWHERSRLPERRPRQRPPAIVGPGGQRARGARFRERYWHRYRQRVLLG